MSDRRCGWYTVAGVAGYLVSIVVLLLLPLESMYLFGSIFALATALVSGYFVIGYFKLSRWSESEEGVHLLVFSAVVGVVLTWVFMSRFFDLDPEVRFRIGVGVYVTLFFLMAWRAVIFTRRQLAARKKRRIENAAR
jgi:amino acid transporter